jgi:hypothetical protein
MVGTKRARLSNEACDGRRQHTPGLDWDPGELGPITTEAATIWDTLRRGESVTLLCDRCGARLLVAIKVSTTN